MNYSKLLFVGILVLMCGHTQTYRKTQNQVNVLFGIIYKKIET